MVQIAVSGPDLPMANIMFSYFAAINSALEKLYITTPYFIPNESILDAIKRSALSGVDVRLLVPGEGDSKFVNAASCSYYEELLSTGVRIFRYQKGFVHAKTITVDDNLSIIGTANMDIRSFHLNFEVNAMVYDKRLNQELNTAFINDIKQSKELKLDVWSKRNQLKKFGDASARLVSSLL
ncbi:Cardiolipin synthase [compost metagenome]